MKYPGTYLLVFILLSTLHFVKAQTDSLNRDFIKLKTGKTIYGNKLEHEYESSNVFLDGVKYKTNTLNFYNKNGVLYARIGDALVFHMYSSVATRDSVDFFTVISNGSNGSQKLTLFYTCNYSKPKKATVGRMYKYMKGDQETESYMRSAKGAAIGSGICFTGAAGILLFGINNGINGSNIPIQQRNGIDAFGAVILISGIILNTVKRHSFKRALNRYYQLGID